MARYQVKAPDGAVYTLEGPEGASQEQVIAIAQQLAGANHRKVAAQIEADPITQGARNFTDDMGSLRLAAAGYGKAGADLVRGAGQLIPGLVSREDVAESRRLDAPLMATTAGKAGNITGNVAALAPAALIPGANSLLVGAGIGAATGLLQPSTSTKETLTNALLGTAGGAVVPAAGAVYRTARAAAEPFHEAGRQAIVGRALNRAAGQDAPAVAQRLQEAAAPFVGPSQGAQRATMGELVPGSVPTVGQAAGNAGVAALERAATAGNPEVTNAVASRLAQQNEARSGMLRELAGTDGEREFHVAARDATADQLYGQARRAGVDPAAMTPEAQQNIAAFAARVPPDVMAYAQRLAQISGEPMDNGTSVAGLHWVKKAIDGLIGQAQRSGDGAAVRAYTGLQQDLLAGLDNLSPAYGTARREFAAMSRPINAMDTVQGIADRAVNPLTGNVQPAAFARAFNDGAAVRSTGMPNATLEGTLPNSQMNSLNMLLDDLRRSSAAQRTGPGSDTVQKLAYSGVMDQAGLAGSRTGLRVLSGVPVIGRIGSAAGEAYDRASVDLNRRLAEVMLDPGQAAQLMTQATPRELNQLLRLVQRAGSGLAIASPAATNALQQ